MGEGGVAAGGRSRGGGGLEGGIAGQGEGGYRRGGNRVGTIPVYVIEGDRGLNTHIVGHTHASPQEEAADFDPSREPLLLREV